MDAKLNAIIESMHDEMIDTLQKWIRVPSVKGEAAPGAPFGKEVRSMLDMALADCEQMGFRRRTLTAISPMPIWARAAMKTRWPSWRIWTWCPRATAGSIPPTAR